jgi:hypothetical protein
MGLKHETKLSSSFKKSFKIIIVLLEFVKSIQVFKMHEIPRLHLIYKNSLTTLHILSIFSVDNLHIAMYTCCRCVKLQGCIKSTQEFPNYTRGIVNPF